MASPSLKLQAAIVRAFFFAVFYHCFALKFHFFTMQVGVNSVSK